MQMKRNGKIEMISLEADGFIRLKKAKHILLKKKEDLMIVKRTVSLRKVNMKSINMLSSPQTKRDKVDLLENI